MLSIATVVARATPAEACTCCDGHTNRDPLGWSPSGQSLIVDVDSDQACEHYRALELWRVGGKRPVACFDRYADPDRRVPCDELSAASGTKPKTSRRLAAFPRPALRLDPALVHATLAPAAPIDGHPSLWLTVSVLGGKGWERVWTGRANEGGSGENDEAPIRALAIAILPAPNGRDALLVVANDYTMPGIGHFTTEMRWITLPAGTDVARAEPREDPGGLRAWRHQPVPARKRAFLDTAEARRWNSAGLAHHRAGRYDAAAGSFLLALRSDPGSAAARYDLACAMARAGLLERARRLLEELRDPRCTDCGPWLERARTDADLAGLRSAVAGP